MKWRILRVGHTVCGITTHRWWLLKPEDYFQSFVAEEVGTFEECRKAFIAVGRGQR